MTDEQRLKMDLIKEHFQRQGLGLTHITTLLTQRGYPSRSLGEAVERLYADIEKLECRPC